MTSLTAVGAFRKEAPPGGATKDYGTGLSSFSGALDFSDT